MDSVRNRFWHCVDCVRLFPAHLDLHDIRFGRDNLANSLTTKAPKSVQGHSLGVLFESRVSCFHTLGGLTNPIRDVKSECVLPSN